MSINHNYTMIQLSYIHKYTVKRRIYEDMIQPGKFV